MMDNSQIILQALSAVILLTSIVVCFFSIKLVRAMIAIGTAMAQDAAGMRMLVQLMAGELERRGVISIVREGEEEETQPLTSAQKAKMN